MQIDDIRGSDVISNPFVAGAAGALLGLRSMTGSTWRERLLHLIIGMVCAGYGAPALSDWLQMSSPRVQSFLAFGFGAFGVSIYVAVVEGIKQIEWARILVDVIEGFTRHKDQ